MEDWNRYKDSEGGIDAVYIADYPPRLNGYKCVLFYNNGKGNIVPFCQASTTADKDELEFIRKKIKENG